MLEVLYQQSFRRQSSRSMPSSQPTTVPKRPVNIPILQKVGAFLPRFGAGTVALGAIYLYVYGWDESQQIAQAARDAKADAQAKK